MAQVILGLGRSGRLKVDHQPERGPDRR
jgi:hypothetical protein